MNVKQATLDCLVTDGATIQKIKYGSTSSCYSDVSDIKSTIPYLKFSLTMHFTECMRSRIQ